MKYLALILLLLSCSSTSIHQRKGPKNIIYIIGDGMGPQQVGLLLNYLRHAKSAEYKESGFEKFIKEGSHFTLSTHSPYNSLVMDSATSATHLSTGAITRPGVVGMDHDGKSVQTILEKAKSLGMSTGLISDTRATHATPAAFATHVISRNMENEIAEQYVENSSVDILLSGGLRHFIPQNNSTKFPFKVSSKRKDERNLIKEAQDKGYETVFDLDSLKKSKGKILGLFSESGMMNGIVHTQTKKDKTRQQPTLLEMTKATIRNLENNDKGFFLMIEAGQIDWAAHSNDTATMLHEMLKLDEVLHYLHEWSKNQEDTLIVITADHETGSFGFSQSRLNIPGPVKLKGGQTYQVQANFAPQSLLDAIYAQKKSLDDMLSEFFTQADLTPRKLREIVNQNSEFKISLSEAKNILESEANDTYHEEIRSLKTKSYPKMNSLLKYFYIYGESTRVDLLGLTLSKYNNSAWGTGAHTNTPVPVIIWGPEKYRKQYEGILRHYEIGKIGLRLLD